MNLFGILFCRKNAVIDDVTINHESIHTAQMKEMLYIPFYIWYAVEYLFHFLKYWANRAAYRSISFECEAYLHEYDPEYLKTRKHFAWFKFM